MKLNLLFYKVGIASENLIETNRPKPDTFNLWIEIQTAHYLNIYFLLTSLEAPSIYVYLTCFATGPSWKQVL